MKQSDHFSNRYIFFRYPTSHILILLPLAVGFIISLFIDRELNPNQFSDNPFLDAQDEVLDNYLFWARAASSLLLAFFICYRWSSMQNSGSYGFWLTQGVSRRNFFILTSIKFIRNLYFSILLGFTMLYYINSWEYSVFEIITINLLIFCQIVILVTLAVFVGNAVRNPELAALTYIGLGIANFAFNTDEDSFVYKLANPDLQYNNDEASLVIILTIITGFVLSFISLFLHQRFDLEL